MRAFGVKTRKPWTCEMCGKEFPAGTLAYDQRDGFAKHVEGFGVVFIDGTFRYCEPCYRVGQEPKDAAE